MSRSFSNYQRGGLYGHGTFAKTPLVPAMAAVDQEITRALGVPDLLRLGGGNNGIGRHKQGLAVDYQGGIGNDEVHGEFASYALDKDNWLRHNGRYLAFKGFEYIAPHKGAMWVRRVQPWYGGSDPWHTNHVHYDLWDAGPNGANPNVPIGSWRSSSKEVTGATKRQIMRAQELLKDLGLYTGIVGGGLGSLTRAAVTDYQKAAGLTPDGVPGTKTIEHMEGLVMSITSDLGKIKTAIERLERSGEQAVAIGTQNQREIRELKAQILPSDNGNSIHSKVMKTNNAVGEMAAEMPRILDRLAEVEKKFIVPDDASALLADFDAGAEA